MHIADFAHRHARRQRHRRRRHLDHHRRRAGGADGEARAASRSRSSATARRMPGRSTNASTSRRRGNCRCSTCARTTCTPPTPRPPRPMRWPTWRRAPPATAFPASSSTATTSSRSIRRPTPRWSGRAPGGGPSLIECKTYRWRGHTERRGQPDPRDPAEVEAWKGRDPIALLERRLREQGELDDAGLQGIEGDIMGALEAASPSPRPARSRCPSRRPTTSLRRDAAFSESHNPLHSGARAEGREPGTHLHGALCIMGSGFTAARAPRNDAVGLCKGRLMEESDDARADLQRSRARSDRRGNAARPQDLLHVDRRAAAAPQGVRRRADQRDADHRGGADRHGDRRRRLRLPPDRRLAAGDVLLCRDGPDRQPGREDPLHVRRPGDFPDPLSRRGRRRRPGRGAALAVALFDVHECRRAEDVPAVDAARHEGAAEDRDPRQQPGHLVRIRAG